MWKKEKNEYPKWKFIDPSGVKVGGEGGNEAFVHTFSQTLLFIPSVYTQYELQRNAQSLRACRE